MGSRNTNRNYTPTRKMMDADTNASALASLEDAHDMIQIIDEDGGWVYVEAAPMTFLLSPVIITYLRRREGLSNKMGKWNFDNKGFDYWVVSILGCQSSGKSTCTLVLDFFFAGPCIGLTD